MIFFSRAGNFVYSVHIFTVFTNNVGYGYIFDPVLMTCFDV